MELRDVRTGALVGVPSTGEPVRGIVCEGPRIVNGLNVGTERVYVGIVEPDGSVSGYTPQDYRALTLVSLHTPRHSDGAICGRAIYVGDCPLGHQYR